MKKFLVILLIVLTASMPVFANEKIKMKASITQNFSIESVGKNISFTLKTPCKINDIELPIGTDICSNVYYFKPERRFHKSGYFKCHLLSYTLVNSNLPVDISNENIYVIARRYDKINKCDAAFTGTEITATTAASIFLPGVDVVYYFIKGAALKNKDNNRFISGVHNAYDNSIFWVFEKGKPINLKTGDNIIMVSCKHNKESIKLVAPTTTEDPIDVDDIDAKKFNIK